MLGFLMSVGIDPVQIPNNASYKTGVGVENLDTVLTLDICDDDSFPSQFVYTLQAGEWYAYSGSNPFWCRISPIQNGQPVQLGASCQIWINPGGAANIGGMKSAGSGALAVDVVQPNPLPVVIQNAGTPYNVGPTTNPPAGQDFTFPLPQAGRLLVFQAVLVTSNVIAARYPYFTLGVLGLTYRFIMSHVVIHRSNTWNFVGAPDFQRPYSRTADQVVNFGIPNIYLPAGTVIGSYTGNLDAGDYWYNIAMALGPA